MNFIDQISAFVPSNEQEHNDKRIILTYTEQFPHNILLRENEIAHITSSGFIINHSLDQVLMIHHNIRNAWAWTGGHADGDANLLNVAIKEAKEETGVHEVIPLSNDIASLDILPVYGHIKKGKYVSTHLHLSVSFIFICNEKENLKINDEENSGVKWLSIGEITGEPFDTHDIYLYGKLIEKAKQINDDRVARNHMAK